MIRFIKKIAAQFPPIKKLLYERYLLSCQNEALTEERSKLRQGNEALADERSKLRRDNEALTDERNKLLRDNEALTDERSKLRQYNETLEEERYKLGRDNEALTAQRDKLFQHDPIIVADKIARLYADKAIWQKFTANGLKFVKEKYSKDMALREMLKLLDMRRCTVCGAAFSMSQIEKTDNLRETPVCLHCGAINRYQDVASVILNVIGSKKSFLRDALAELNEKSVYLLESYGAIYNSLCNLPSFTCSEFYEGISPGVYKGKIRCENVENLTFPDGVFDIVIDQDIFEHVNEPEKGFREIRRVLKPGGYHITTIPYYRSLEKNRKRSVLSGNEITHLLPPMYHGDPIRSGGGMVFTDFGMELFDNLKNAGFDVTTYETELPDYNGGYNCVFICRKV